MIGIITNTLAIALGSVIGGVFKKGVKEEYQDSLMAAMGLAALGLGINAVVSNMPKSVYPVLFVVSLAVGSLIGEIWNLDGKFTKLLDLFSLGNLGTGISTGILLSCMGSLSILGPIESALNNNQTYLFTNSTLDFITFIALAATYGVGMIFVAPVLFTWQTSIFLGARYLEPFMTPQFMAELSIVGGFLIFASGLSILKIKEFKSMNLLPALLIPIVWFTIINFF
ncbi:hypothetical protein BG261_00830 [Floricoccus tropicus]|uniref:DUF554 domain-containing protein n=1 Tax=Floricoccus tropicus TaxID=1859473 RepID=A0A1E8GQF9_9LACT|nr:DUF554 domain-containing protein [Floricoccus tropicus]OFI50457.1 hypothetical protein BG261_00830 [Floricoccus tropicus]